MIGTQVKSNHATGWLNPLMSVAWGCVVALLLASLVPGQALAQRKKTACISGETPRAARYKVEKGETLPASIKAPLNGKRGNAEKGVEWMANRRQGNCLSCHTVTKILERVKEGDHESESKFGFHGTVAPPLDGVADRYSEAELRIIVVDAKQAFPDINTSMPAYHRKDGFERVSADCKGLVILSAERVEDIVAYLTTLKEQ